MTTNDLMDNNNLCPYLGIINVFKNHIYHKNNSEHNSKYSSITNTKIEDSKKIKSIDLDTFLNSDDSDDNTFY